MNKTVTANIAGFIFNIEEQAYQSLSTYLENIRANFGDEQERDEIMRDIEMRIAELFQSMINECKQVIIEADVTEVVEVMGQPEDYATDDYQEEPEPVTMKASKKKLFRDPDNAMLFGVCSGLAAYLGIDVLLIRIAFIIFGIGGTGIVAYIVLIFVIPEALTTADKLRMRGEPVNVESIKKAFHKSKDHIEKSGGKVKEKARKVANNGAGAARKFFRIVGKIFGFGLIAFGVTMSIILFSLFLGEGGVIPLIGDGSTISYAQFMDIVFHNQLQGNMMTIGLCMVIGIPILGAIFIGIKLLLGIKGSIKGFTVSAVCGWVIGCILCAVTGLQLGLEFQDQGSVDYKVELPNPATDTLYLDVQEDVHFSNNISYQHGIQIDDLLSTDKENILFGYPALEIRRTDIDTNFSVQLIKESRGITQKQAIVRAENIVYNIDTAANQISFSPYFTSSLADKWRGQNATIVVNVPNGKTVHISKNLDRILHHTEYLHGMNSTKMVDHYWTMEDKSLKCTGCSELRRYELVEL